MSRPPAPVRGRKLFDELARSSRRVRSGPVTVHFVPSQVPNAVLVSYSVGRKVGGAVVRNRWRRRLRVIAGEITQELKPGAYLIGVGPNIQQLSFAQLRDRVIATMLKVNEDKP